jgi:hypothetical protein
MNVFFRFANEFVQIPNEDIFNSTKNKLIGEKLTFFNVKLLQFTFLEVAEGYLCIIIKKNW